jgi:hypothetical protein
MRMLKKTLGPVLIWLPMTVVAMGCPTRNELTGGTDGGAGAAGSTLAGGHSGAAGAATGAAGAAGSSGGAAGSGAICTPVCAASAYCDSGSCRSRVTEFTLQDIGARPRYITAGGDGNLWFTDSAYDKIRRISTTGTINEFAVLSSTSGLGIITPGPDGNLWFVEEGVGNIGRITPSGTVTEYSASAGGLSIPIGITAGPGGNIWFTDSTENHIGISTPAGIISFKPLVHRRRNNIIMTMVHPVHHGTNHRNEDQGEAASRTRGDRGASIRAGRPGEASAGDIARRRRGAWGGDSCSFRSLARAGLADPGAVPRGGGSWSHGATEVGATGPRRSA